MTYRFNPIEELLGYTYMGAGTVNEPEDYEDVIVANKGEPLSDMDQALTDWDAAIDQWGEEQDNADEADADYKHWRSSQVTAYFDDGFSVSRAEVMVTATEKYVEELTKVTKAKTKAEMCKKKITVAEARFQKARSEYSASRNV